MYTQILKPSKHRQGRVGIVTCLWGVASLKCKVIAPGRWIYTILYGFSSNTQWMKDGIGAMMDGWIWFGETWLIYASHLAFLYASGLNQLHQIAWLVLGECNQKATYKSDMSDFMNSFLFTDSTDTGNGHQVDLSLCTSRTAMRV